MRSAVRFLTALMFLSAGAASALADGMIVPVREDHRVRGQWAVKYHHVTINVRDQVADVTVDQAFVNLGATELLVEYLFPIPPGAAIDQMTLIADGREMPGTLLKADEARRIFEDIVRRKRDPALLEYVGYGLYKTSVFPIPPRGERRIVVHYTVLCEKDRDLVEVMYPLNTEKFSARPIESVRVTVDIRGEATIGSVYSPSHDLKVERIDPDRVKATYEVENAIPSTDFQLVYQEGIGEVGASLISHRTGERDDGYFMLLVSPNPGTARQRVIAKDIVFVLDHSGSMRDGKLEQAAQSLIWTLRHLNPEDRFNVVRFSDSVEPLFTSDLVDADREHVDRAIEMVERFTATGGTNIKDALTTAMRLLPRDSERPAYVLFLTDGEPTVGETDEGRILEAAAEANRAKARLFSLGVGYDVNVRLIDRLSRDNRGLSEYVRPKEPLETKISGLYQKIRNPVMTDLAVEFRGVRVRDSYPRELGDLFDGSQIVLVGRYEEGGEAQLVIRGRYEGREKTFEYPVRFVRRSEDISRCYVERLWAARRVGFLMDEIALHGEKQELVDELIRLSRDYGIMTPYTSFLAEEDTHLADEHELRRRGAESMGRLNLGPEASGEAAQRNAVVREQLSRADRFPQAAARPAPASEAAYGPGGGRGGMVVADGAGRSLGAVDDATILYGGAVVGNRSQQTYEDQQTEVLTTVRQVGDQTLYRRGNRWASPDLADAEPASLRDVQTVRQFSDEYFALARANNALENRVMATQQAGEELLIRLRGQVYRILPADGG